MQSAADEVLLPLLTTALVSYLPVQSSPMLTLAAYQAGKLVGPMARDLLALPGRWLGGLWTSHSVIIESDNSLFQSFEEYLIRNYLPQLRQCRLQPKNGDVNYDLRNALLSAPIKIPYAGNTIEVHIGEPPKPRQDGQAGGSGQTYDLTLSSRAPLRVIREFVVSVCEHQVQQSTQTLRIYRNSVKTSGEKKKKGSVCWEKIEIFTNRNLGNTILDHAVEAELLDDVKEFLASKEWHNAKGVPFKRGYLLSGPPGTGKTSIVKALAVHYNLPIFSLDLSTVENNNQLTQLMAEINYLAKGQVYILSMEDVDRCALFQRYGGDRELTIDCLLNVLDGIAESYGRLLFMSANDVGPLRAVPALLRPGRVDRTVLINHVTDDQLRRMIAGFYAGEELPEAALESLSAPAGLSPAQVINTLRSYRRDAAGGISALAAGRIAEKGAEEKLAINPRKRRPMSRRKLNPVQRHRREVLQLTSQKARIEKQQILAVARNERRMELAKEKLERALLADKTAKQKAKAAKVKAKAKLTSKASSSAKAKPAKSTSKASSSPAPKRQASKRSVQAAKRTKVKE